MFYCKESDGITLFIRLTPRAARDAITGIEKSADDRTYLAIRVRAVPEDGKANKALIKFLAREMKIPTSAISLASGGAARFKQLHITGDSAVLIRMFDDKLKSLPD